MLANPVQRDINFDTIEKYLELRKHKLIGQTWIESGSVYVAPLTASHGYNAREITTRTKWICLVEETWGAYLLSQKKGVESANRLESEEALRSEMDYKKAV